MSIKFKISERGVSIYFSMIILSIMLAIALSLTTILINQTRMIKGMGDSVVAFYAADTAIEEILYKNKVCLSFIGCGSASWICVDTVDCDDGISSLSSPTTGNVGPATYTATFDDGATNITAIGKYFNNRRGILVSQ